MSAETTDSGAGERVAEQCVRTVPHDAHEFGHGTRWCPGLPKHRCCIHTSHCYAGTVCVECLPATPDADDASEHRPNACCDFHRHIADGCCHCGDDASTGASES